MADGRLRVIGVPPSGGGLSRALAEHVVEGAVVTSFDDAKLRSVASLLPEVDVDVSPLGDLVGRFLTMLGEPVARLCPSGQLQATVDLICRELDSDSPLSDSGQYKGTAELVVDRLKELHDWDFTADEIRELAEDASGSLSAKLVTLAEIDESIRHVFEETNRQHASDRVRSCLGIPPDNPLPVVKIIAFTASAERPLYESWLKWVVGFGIDVTVLVDWNPGAAHVFAQSQRIASRLGVEIESFETETPWYSGLFSDKVVANAPKIEILCAPDPLSESEWAIRGCLRRIADGSMPNNLTIFARDAETYAPLLQASASRLGVQINANLTVPLLTNGFADLTLRCIETLAGDDVRMLSRLAISSYLLTPHEERKLLRDATKEAYSKGTDQWSAMTEWACEREGQLAWLKHLLVWREQAESSRASLGSWLLRMRELVGGTSMIDLGADEYANTRSRDIRAQTVLQRSITDYSYIYDRSGRPELSLSSFVQLARTLWDEETMVIEGVSQGVKFCSNTSSLTSCDTLFVLGMLEGSLPRRRTEDPILFDKERAELSELAGRSVRLNNSRDKAAIERDEFVRICSASSKEMVLSYPQTDENRDNVPAFYLDELERSVGAKTVRTFRPRSETVPLKEDCLSAADVEMRDALEGKRDYPEIPKLFAEAAKEAVRPQFEEGVRPEELARALTCPFQSVMRYRLRVFAPIRRRLMRSLRDLPASAHIASAQDPDSAREHLRGQINEYMQDLYSDLEGWELSMLQAAAERMADEWIEREFSARDLWKSDLSETQLDVRLGENGLRNDPKVGGRTIKLKGRATSMTTAPGHTVLRFFDSSTPDLREVQDLPEDNESAFLYGLYLMAQYHLGQHSPMVEIDGMNGQRVLAGFPPTVDEMRRNPSAGLQVHRVADKPVVFFKNLKDKLKQAVEVLEEGDMKPNPGRHCEFCAYGELCRVSSMFGEVRDPFEGGNK